MDTDLKRPYPPWARVEVDFSRIGKGWLKGIVIEDLDRRAEAVRFDESERMFHDLNGKCERNHGWYCGMEVVRLLKTKEIENDPEYKELFI